MTSIPAPDSAPKARAIAFYLPQFHPTPENDAWWGKGFTEWTNVAPARPRFKGHYQPHVPADLGFYDLRVAETRVAQADLARSYGIEGFCYYHYWFQGKRLLHRPIDDVLATGAPDFPFCLCWANQSWTRTWSGREAEVLIRQAYDEADHARHIEWLCQVFADPRYLKVSGRPLFLIYLPEHIPNISAVIESWRSTCIARIGVEPWLCGVRTGYSSLENMDIKRLGFDGVVEFEPNRNHFPIDMNSTGRTVSALRRLLPNTWYEVLTNSRWLRNTSLSTLVDYKAYVSNSTRRPAVEEAVYPSVFPSWDNTARRKSATIIENHSPESFKLWVKDQVGRVLARDRDQRLLFINAWNEWAEGCHLEPDQMHGHGFLRALQSGLGLQEAGNDR